MPDILNPLNFFWKLGYRRTTEDVYAKSYSGSYTVKIDFVNETIEYGNRIRIGNSAIASFSQRNYVVAECVDRLLVKGYHPSNIYVGYTDEADIAIKDNTGSLVGIRCRRWDNDAYDIEVNTIKLLRDKPVIIGIDNEQFRFLCIYASTLKSGLIDFGYTLFPLSTGNWVTQDPLKDEAVSSTMGFFENDIEPYRPIVVKTSFSKDIRTVKTDSGYSEFEIQNNQLTRYAGNSKTVVIPQEIKRLKNGVFWDRPEIEEVTLPESLESLGGETFSDCPNLVDLTIPQNVSAIGDNPFCNCPSLKLKNNSNISYWTTEHFTIKKNLD